MACYGSDGEPRKVMRVPAAALVIWAPVTFGDLQRRPRPRPNDFLVVIVPHTIFESDAYQKRRSGRVAIHAEDVLYSLHGICWDRLVVDEAHLVPTWGPKSQAALLALRRDRVHLMSCSPQQGGGSRGGRQSWLGSWVPRCAR